MGFSNGYTLAQWLLTFYIYCFMGWVWECSYVSVRIRKWTNRGFMHGPLLPIYGSGAITMLFATLPVRNNVLLVFIVSSLSATALELVTGTVMEELFKVRYWDYTRYKINYKGHICLVASTAWGVAGVITVFAINKPIEKLVLSIPASVASLVAFAITVAAACDFGASFREAMDVREIFDRLSESTERQIKRFEKRVDVMAAVYGDELRSSVSQHVEQIRQEYYEKMSELKSSGAERVDWAKEKLEMLTDSQKARLVRFINTNPDAESRFGAVSDVLKTLKKGTGIIIEKVRTLDDRDSDKHDDKDDNNK